MWRLALAGLLAACAQGLFIPSASLRAGFAHGVIRWLGSPGKQNVMNVLAPKDHPNEDTVPKIAFELPQELTIKHEFDSISPAETPHFTLQPDGTITWAGMCIDGGGYARDAIRVNHCTGGPSQVWNLIPWDDGRKNLIQLQQTNKCIDASSLSDSGAAQVRLRECDYIETEAWTFEPAEIQNVSRQPSPSPFFWHVISCTSLVALGASLSAWLWWRRRQWALAARRDVVLDMEQGGVSLTEHSAVHQDSCSLSSEFYRKRTNAILMEIDPIDDATESNDEDIEFETCFAFAQDGDFNPDMGVLARCREVLGHTPAERKRLHWHCKVLEAIRYHDLETVRECIHAWPALGVILKDGDPKYWTSTAFDAIAAVVREDAEMVEFDVAPRSCGSFGEAKLPDSKKVTRRKSFLNGLRWALLAGRTMVASTPMTVSAAPEQVWSTKDFLVAIENDRVERVQFSPDGNQVIIKDIDGDMHKANLELNSEVVKILQSRSSGINQKGVVMVPRMAQQQAFPPAVIDDLFTPALPILLFSFLAAATSRYWNSNSGSGGTDVGQKSMASVPAAAVAAGPAPSASPPETKASPWNLFFSKDQRDDKPSETTENKSSQWWPFGATDEEKSTAGSEAKEGWFKSKGEQKSKPSSESQEGWFSFKGEQKSKPGSKSKGEQKSQQKSQPSSDEKEGWFKLPRWVRSLASTGNEIADIEVQQKIQQLPSKKAQQLLPSKKAQLESTPESSGLPSWVPFVGDQPDNTKDKKVSNKPQQSSSVKDKPKKSISTNEKPRSPKLKAPVKKVMQKNLSDFASAEEGWNAFAWAEERLKTAQSQEMSPKNKVTFDKESQPSPKTSPDVKTAQSTGDDTSQSNLLPLLDIDIGKRLPVLGNVSKDRAVADLNEFFQFWQKQDKKQMLELLTEDAKIHWKTLRPGQKPWVTWSRDTSYSGEYSGTPHGSHGPHPQDIRDFDMFFKDMDKPVSEDKRKRKITLDGNAMTVKTSGGLGFFKGDLTMVVVFNGNRIKELELAVQR